MAVELADLCNTVQQNLAGLAGNNYPALRREPTGFLDAVTSPTNTAGFTTKYLTDEGDGKLKQVVREWAVPVPLTSAVSTEQDICGTGVEEPRIQDIVTLTGYTGSQVMQFSDSELRKYCEAPSEVMTMRIAQNMSGVFRKLDQQMIAKYLANVGKFIGGVAKGKSIKMLYNDGVTEAAVPDGEITILEDMADLGTGRPIVVGAGIVSRYSRLAHIGCCNDYGQGIEQLSGNYDFYRDRDVSIVAAGTPASPVIVFSPGAVQLATYNKYRGEFKQVVTNLYSHTTTVDPVTGLLLDTKIKYDDCDEVWKMQFGIHWDLFQLPALFKSTDERFGVNYSFLYNATEGVPA